MDLQTVERGLFIGSLVLTLVLLLKLWKEGFYSRYKFLMLYLAWSAVGDLALIPLRRDRMTYFYVFAGLRFVQWILDVLVTLDLVALITKRYPGITTMARVAVSVCLAIATAATLISAMIDLKSMQSSEPILIIARFVDRTISFSVLTFLGLMLIFLLWFPIRLSRNTVAYAAGFILLFASRFCALLINNLMGPSSSQALSAAKVAVFCMILVYWIVRISVRNEDSETVVGHAWNRTEERRLVGQLESINAVLMRSKKANPR